MYWGRDCIDDRKIEIGCEHREYNGSEIEICVCKEEGCNKEMNEISTTTSKATTTPKGNHSSICSSFFWRYRVTREQEYLINH